MTCEKHGCPLTVTITDQWLCAVCEKARADAAEAQSATLREALKPFADTATSIEESDYGTGSLDSSDEVTVSAVHFINARAALDSTTKAAEAARKAGE